MSLIFPTLLLDKCLMQTKVVQRLHSYRNIWKAKEMLTITALLAGPFQTLCSQQTKLSNNRYLENKATSVLADLRGSGNSLRLWFAVIHAVTLLVQVLSEFCLVLSSTLRSSTRVCVDWELRLLANSLNMKSLFWVQKTGYADQNHAVSSCLGAKKQSVSSHLLM